MAVLGGGALPHAKKTVMIYAVSGEGKTGQIGELAKAEWRRSGKKTLLHSMDHGGFETVRHLVDAGVIDIVPHIGRLLPWEWSMKIAQGGVVPNAEGQWAQVDPEEYGLVAFDGASGLADSLMKDLAQKAGSGKNPVGQKPAIMFREGTEMITNNSPAHFGLTQQHVSQVLQESFSIPVNMVLWTALARNAEEEASQSGIVGPMIAGKAMTASVPQWFMYTFRISAIPGNPAMGTVASTRLYLHPHMEGVAAGSKGLANPRGPVGVALPDFIEPASVVEALALIDGARVQAIEDWKAGR